MINILKKEDMGSSNLGWLNSRFHFSFAEYRNPDNINFGVLRVLNDDIIQPKSGFDFHPHQNVEIISYIVNGEITHKDSMGNEETLRRGEVQYLSAGDGIYHSEHNLHSTKELRLLQIWILPPQNGLPRLYGSHRFKEEERKNKLLKIVSSKTSNVPIKLHQDVNIFVSELDKNKEIDFNINSNRQVYFIQIEGSCKINDTILDSGDALEVVNEKSLNIKTLENSHFLFLEMKES